MNYKIEEIARMYDIHFLNCPRAKLNKDYCSCLEITKQLFLQGYAMRKIEELDMIGDIEKKKI